MMYITYICDLKGCENEGMQATIASTPANVVRGYVGAFEAMPVIRCNGGYLGWHEPRITHIDGKPVDGT